MSMLKQKSEPTAPSEIESLKADLKKQKDASRLRSKYGAGLKDQQIDEMLEKEREQAALAMRLKKEEEADRLAKIERDGRIRALACQLVKEGRLIISVDGTRVPEIKPDLKLQCPACGAEINEVFGIYELVNQWEKTPADQRFGSYSLLVVRNARNPLGNFIGALSYLHHARCPCGKTSLVFAQLVLV
jgi:hypothetical protein